MTVQLANRQAGGRCTYVCDDTGTAHDVGKIREILIIPGWRNVFEYCRFIGLFGGVPGNAKAIAIQWLISFLTMVTLMDDRVGGIGYQRA